MEFQVSEAGWPKWFRVKSWDGGGKEEGDLEDKTTDAEGEIDKRQNRPICHQKGRGNPRTEETNPPNRRGHKLRCARRNSNPTGARSSARKRKGDRIHAGGGKRERPLAVEKIRTPGGQGRKGGGGDGNNGGNIFSVPLKKGKREADGTNLLKSTVRQVGKAAEVETIPLGQSGCGPVSAESLPRDAGERKGGKKIGSSL